MRGDPRDARPIGDARPDVWIVADGPVDAALAAVEACGFRVTRQMTIADAMGAVAIRRGDPLVVVEISEILSDDAVDVLDLLNAQASDSRAAVIVSCMLSALDGVSAQIDAPYATVLCDPSPVDRVVALQAALPAIAGVAEDRAAEAQQLVRLTDEVARIARVIAGLPHKAVGVNDGLVGYRGPPGSRASVAVDAGDIRAMIRWRRRRDALFPGEIFADPAWDMILDLAAAQIENRDVSVSSLCIAAAVPATTALRWIKTLTDAGVFERVADPHDRRRIYIRLADRVSTAVLRFLGEAKGAGAVLI